MEQYKNISVGIVPFTSEVISATKEHVFIKEIYLGETFDQGHDKPDECVIKVKRKDFNYMIKKWLNEKTRMDEEDGINTRMPCGGYFYTKTKFIEMIEIPDYEFLPKHDIKVTMSSLPLVELVSFDRTCYSDG